MRSRSHLHSSGADVQQPRWPSGPGSPPQQAPFTVEIIIKTSDSDPGRDPPTSAASRASGADISGRVA
eukprot:42285-Eustigmatos_ZCMA.PRE.1